MLLDLGANIYASDLRKWTALHYASYNGKNEVVRMLCKYDDDRNKLRHMKNSQGRTAREIVSKEKTKVYFESRLSLTSTLGVCSHWEARLCQAADHFWRQREHADH